VRLLSRFDGKPEQWRIAEGVHSFALAKSPAEPVLSDEVTLRGGPFGRQTWPRGLSLSSCYDESGHLESDGAGAPDERP
jgi:hypothetical protein